MHRKLFASAAAFLVALLILNTPGVQTFETLLPEGPGAAMVSAASKVFSGLTPAQKAKALFDVASQERFDWHFIPRERKGLPIKELSSEGQEKVAALLLAGLGKDGATRARRVMGLESVLAEIEGPNRKFPRDPILYFVSFFGEPSARGRWGWRFEGHHLAVNAFLDGEKVLAATPLFYGANPAMIKDGPRKGERVLDYTEDLGRDLVKSLDEASRKASLGEEVPDEVGGTGEAKYTGPFPAGVAASSLGTVQEQKLLALIQAYLKNLPTATLETLLGPSPQALLEGAHFAWRGGLEPFEGHSYMVYTPKLLIQYANFQNGAAHVHSCLRLRKGEFGEAE